MLGQAATQSKRIIGLALALALAYKRARSALPAGTPGISYGSRQWLGLRPHKFPNLQLHIILNLLNLHKPDILTL